MSSTPNIAQLLSKTPRKGQKVAGLITPGNIDLYNRPSIPNPEGGSSTVFSTSFDEDGREILVPRAVGNRILSNEEAIKNYKLTGQHLGIFDSPAAADAYAQQLHNDYAAGKYGLAGAPPPTGGETPKTMTLMDLLSSLLNRGGK